MIDISKYKLIGCRTNTPEYWHDNGAYIVISDDKYVSLHPITEQFRLMRESKKEELFYVGLRFHISHETDFQLTRCEVVEYDPDERVVWVKTIKYNTLEW